jgi:hypothetical protein
MVEAHFAGSVAKLSGVADLKSSLHPFVEEVPYGFK